MKHFYALLIITCLTTFKLSAQDCQFTIKAGTQANSVTVYFKPGSTQTGQISSMQLTVAVPASVSSKPTASILKNYYGAAGQISYPAPYQSKETTTDGDMYVYTFDGVGGASQPTETYTAGSEYAVLEIAFSDGPANTPSQVRLIQIPNGGTSGDNPGQYNCYMAIGGNDVTNPNPFYGSTASNDGHGYEGYSYASIAGIMLPVTWHSFTASLKDNAAVLDWAAEEKDSKFFDITRSLDGVKFTSIGQQASKGNGLNAYQYIDAAVTKVKSQGDIFYQLVQVDKNGKATQSAVRTVRITLPVGGISVSPNPVQTIATVRFNHPKEEKATLRVTDTNGKVVYQMSTQLVKGYNQKEINTSGFSKGNYNLSVISNSTNKTIKLVKSGQ